MAFSLPKLQSRFPIVDSLGRPVNTFLHFFNMDYSGAIQRQEAAQQVLFQQLAAAQAEIIAVQETQQEEIDRLNRVLAGEEEFSAVNVDGTIIAENGGLAESIVTTQAMSVTAIRPGAPATNPALVSVNGLNAVGGDVNAAGATTLVTATFNVPANGEVIIRFTASLVITNAETIELAMFLDYSGTHSMQAIRDIEGVDETRYREIVQHDPAGDSSSAQIVTTQTLTAGSHTVVILGMAKLDANEIIVPAGGAAIEVFTR